MKKKAKKQKVDFFLTVFLLLFPFFHLSFLLVLSQFWEGMSPMKQHSTSIPFS